MTTSKIILRTTIWTVTFITVIVSTFLIYFCDLNKLKTPVEKYFIESLNCKLVLGNLNWDFDNFNVGVSISELTLFDKNENLILQTGNSRLTWSIVRILTGQFIHFKSIETVNPFVNIIRLPNGKINLLDIFPPGPEPIIDNLKINTGIIYFLDNLNGAEKPILFKDLNIDWEKKTFSKKRYVNLTSRIESFTSPSFLKIKGSYSDNKKFNWNHGEIGIYALAKNIRLIDLEPFLSHVPEIKHIAGDFHGVIYLNKKRKERFITLKSRCRMKNFLLSLENKEGKDEIKIPISKFNTIALISREKIEIKQFKSNIGKLAYEIWGKIFKWNKPLVELDIGVKTNNFNFKEIKEILPLSLLPATTRQRIEPINDDGFVTINIAAKGPAIAPKYYGTISLRNFNLSEESGFFEIIKGLEGDLVLDNELLKIERLFIPLRDSSITVMGEVNNKTFTSNIFIQGMDININTLQNIALDVEPTIGAQLYGVDSFGKLDIDLNILSAANIPPNIMGMINFKDSGIWVLRDEFLEVKNVIGELSLDGNNLIFDKLNGLINNEVFLVDGSVSLKEDQKVNVHVMAKHLKVINFLISLIKSQLPKDLTPGTLKGELSDLDLRANGTFLKPVLNGMVFINNIAFNLNNNIMISEINGGIDVNEKSINVSNLMGLFNNSNDFNTSLNVYDYVSLHPTLKGNIEAFLDLPPILMQFNPELEKIIFTDGKIPTKVNFEIKEPNAHLQFLSTFDQMLQFDVKPFFTKPTTHEYKVSGDLNFNTKTQDINLKNLNVTSEDLSFNTRGTIKKITTLEPEVMIDFYTDKDTKVYMLLKPFNALKPVRVFGDVDIKGSINGSPSMFEFSSHADFNQTMIQPSNKPEKRISADHGKADIYFTNKTGELKTSFNDISFETFKGKFINLILEYKDPQFFLKDFSLELIPGFISAMGSFNPKDGSVQLDSEGKDISLTQLGEFILLNPKELAGNTNYKLKINSKGLKEKDIIASSMGDLSFSITNGNIGEIKLLHKGIQAASVFKQGLFGFNLRNFSSLFFKQQDGSFDTINGKIGIKSGKVNIRNLHYRGKNLYLNTYGFVDLIKSFVQVFLYGYLPETTTPTTSQINNLNLTSQSNLSTIDPALEILPDAFKKKRIIIPFISTTPPRYFKIEIKGDLKNQKKIASRAIRSFKWLSGRRLQKEYKYVPKVEKEIEKSN